jgi:EAL domain-containing protein (putative c-di-GMP-specific phosphodiesterase class I)/GGDEF domain-containing protein
VYTINFRSNIKEKYLRIYDTELESIGERLDKSIDETFKLLETINVSEHMQIPDGFYAIGRFSRKEITQFVNSSTPIDPRAMNGEIYARLTGNELKNEYDQPVRFLSYLRKDDKVTFNKDFIVFSKPSIRVTDEYIVLYQELSRFNERMATLDLDNVVFTDDQGVIIASTVPEFRDKYDYLYSNTKEKRVFSKFKYGDVKDNQNLELSIEGVPSFLVKQELSANGAPYCLTGYLASGKIATELNAENIRSLVFVILITSVSFLGSVLILVMYILISRKFVNTSISKGKYSIFVTNAGTILGRNRKFAREFALKSTASTLMLNELGVPNNFGSDDIILRMPNKQGEVKYIRFLSTQTLYGYRLLGTDATDMTTAYLEAKYLSNCDYLTQLPNLKQLDVDYNKLCIEVPNEQFCFEYIDIMDVEKYKVMFGQSFYNQLKVNFAKRLNGIFNGMVYQSGDMRFIIFTKSTSVTKFLTSETDKCTNLISAPIRVDTQFLILEFKGGYCKPVLARDRADLDTMLYQAQVALNAAIESDSRAIVGFYDALMQGESRIYEDRTAVIDLIEKNMLTLHYQPQYNLHQRKIVGFEALTRPREKMNMPIIDFIEHAERNGSIIELGNFVYKTAMGFAKKIEGSGVIVAMNISPVQLMQDGFVSTFLHFYRHFALKPHSIAVEITESFLISNYNRVIRILKTINTEGVDIHLDDFGTVYSSMLYLKKLPISTIKIDREFVRDINYNGYSKMIVEIISQSASHLKLHSIAEGVETKEQAETLRELNCDIIQGYYVGRAVEEQEAMKLIGLTSNDEKPELKDENIEAEN